MATPSSAQLRQKIIALMESTQCPMTNIELAEGTGASQYNTDRAARQLVSKRALTVTRDNRRPTYHLPPPGVVFPSLALARVVKLEGRNMQPDEPLHAIKNGVRGSSLDI